MRLYIRSCEKCRRKVYLNIVFSSRSQLSQYFKNEPITVHCSKCNSLNIRNANEIHAEPSGLPTIMWIIFGIFFGILGVLSTYNIWYVVIGLATGWLVGFITNAREKGATEYFNNSWTPN